MFDRREILLAGAALVASQAVGQAAADEHTHGAAAAGKGTANPALARAANECVRTGEACLEHCLQLLGTGDTSLAECSQAVNQMLAICAAVGPIAVANSKYLPQMARLCVDVCTDCERACRKHEEHHAVCKACAEACAATVAEAKKLAA